MSVWRTKLIAAGVRNLRSFGYPTCDEKNILTDQVFSAFFSSMLKDNKGLGSREADQAIDELLAECSAEADAPEKPTRAKRKQR
jgi:hypothetical protein